MEEFFKKKNIIIDSKEKHEYATTMAITTITPAQSETMSVFCLVVKRFHHSRNLWNKALSLSTILPISCPFYPGYNP